jgi:hypothetical protein
MWLGCFEFLRSCRRALAIRFAQHINCINDPSAIRSTLPRCRARPLGAKRPDQRQSLKAVAETRHRFAAGGLDRPALPRLGLAKRSWLKMSEPLLLDRSNRHHPRQVFAAGSAPRGINRFRKQPSCRMLTECLILAAGRPDASGSGFHPTTFWITLPHRHVVRAGRPSTICRTGRSRMIGPIAFRSRTPRWTCSRDGSAICSMNCSGRAGDSKREHPP